MMACTLLGILSLPLVLIGACIWRIHRHQQRFGRELELMEDLINTSISEPRHAFPEVSHRPGSPDWRKRADWWKQTASEG